MAFIRLTLLVLILSGCRHPDKSGEANPFQALATEPVNAEDIKELQSLHIRAHGENTEIEIQYSEKTHFATARWIRRGNGSTDPEIRHLERGNPAHLHLYLDDSGTAVLAIEFGTPHFSNHVAKTISENGVMQPNNPHAEWNGETVDIIKLWQTLGKTNHSFKITLMN